MGSLEIIVHFVVHLTLLGLKTNARCRFTQCVALDPAVNFGSMNIKHMDSSDSIEEDIEILVSCENFRNVRIIYGINTSPQVDCFPHVEIIWNIIKGMSTLLKYKCKHMI